MNLTLDIYKMSTTTTAVDTTKMVLFNAEDRYDEITLGDTLGVSFSKDGRIVLLTGDTAAVLLAGAALVESGVTTLPCVREFKARVAAKVAA